MQHRLSRRVQGHMFQCLLALGLTVAMHTAHAQHDQKQWCWWVQVVVGQMYGWDNTPYGGFTDPIATLDAATPDAMRGLMS